jgi:hypothetical protein
MTDAHYLLFIYRPDMADDERQKRLAATSLDNVLETCRKNGMSVFNSDEIMATAYLIFLRSRKSLDEFFEAVEEKGGLTVSAQDVISGRKMKFHLYPPDNLEQGENSP